MFKFTHNIKQIREGFDAIPRHIAVRQPQFFKDWQPEVEESGKWIVEEVAYIAFPEREYERRGTSTATLGILNSIVAIAGDDGVMLGITSESSARADTIPVTEAGRARFDTYAGWMMTGGGFLEPLGIDYRPFLDVWFQHFAVVLPEAYANVVVLGAAKAALS